MKSLLLFSILMLSLISTSHAFVSGESLPLFARPAATRTNAIHHDVSTILNNNVNQRPLSMSRNDQQYNIFRRIKKTSSGAAVATSTVALPMMFTIMPGGLVTTAVSEVAAFLPEDPFVEAQILNDLAHVALDLFSFLVPATVAIRAAAVLGRIMVMLADYIPDHHMLPEELFFQSFMLCVAMAGLCKAITPLVLSNFVSEIKMRDGKAFSKLFQPAGLSWEQFKAMTVWALDWKDASPGQLIFSEEDAETEDGEYMFWLYQGDVEVQVQGQSLYNLTKSSTGAANKDTTPTGLALLGETRLLRKLEKYQDDLPFPKLTAKAGPAGATLLRIHTSKLSMLLEHDTALVQSMRKLLFRGVQAKLAAQFERK